MELFPALRKEAKQLKQTIKEAAAGKTKANIFLDVGVYAAFCVLFFSIPSCSFLPKFSLITWGLTIVLMAFIILSFLFCYPIKIDIVNVSLILFSVSSLISSIINGAHGFKSTPMLLTLFTSIIYTYCAANKNSRKFMFHGAFLATIAFLFVFVYRYRHEIASLSFSRLGSAFGDENDISIFMGMGLTFCVYYLFFNKSLLMKFIYVLLAGVFGICGLSSGSKIFFLIAAAVSSVIIFAFIGKKKWWLSMIIILILAGAAIIMLSLPAFATIKARLLDFFSTMKGDSLDGGKTTDYSTIERVYMLLDGFDLFARKPLFGWGSWGFATYGGIGNGWSHNHFSETLCNFGLVGTFFFHVGFVLAFRSYIESKNKKSLTLPFVFLVFYICAMFAVALNSQKIYAFFIGVVIASLYNPGKYKDLDFRKLIHKKTKNENC